MRLSTPRSSTGRYSLRYPPIEMDIFPESPPGIHITELRDVAVDKDDLIASGSYGSVYIINDKHVVKMYREIGELFKEYLYSLLIREEALFRGLEVVKVSIGGMPASDYGLVLERASSDVFGRIADKTYNVNKAPMYFEDLLRNLSVIESYQFVNQDLRDTNVAFDEQDRLRFIDLGSLERKGASTYNIIYPTYKVHRYADDFNSPALNHVHAYLAGVVGYTLFTKHIIDKYIVEKTYKSIPIVNSVIDLQKVPAAYRGIIANLLYVDRYKRWTVPHALGEVMIANRRKNIPSRSLPLNPQTLRKPLPLIQILNALHRDVDTKAFIYDVKQYLKAYIMDMNPLILEEDRNLATSLILYELLRYSRIPSNEKALLKFVLTFVNVLTGLDENNVNYHELTEYPLEIEEGIEYVKIMASYQFLINNDYFPSYRYNRKSTFCNLYFLDHSYEEFNPQVLERTPIAYELTKDPLIPMNITIPGLITISGTHQSVLLIFPKYFQQLFIWFRCLIYENWNYVPFLVEKERLDEVRPEYQTFIIENDQLYKPTYMLKYRNNLTYWRLQDGVWKYLKFFIDNYNSIVQDEYTIDIPSLSLNTIDSTYKIEFH